MHFQDDIKNTPIGYSTRCLNEEIRIQLIEKIKPTYKSQYNNRKGAGLAVSFWGEWLLSPQKLQCCIHLFFYLCRLIRRSGSSDKRKFLQHPAKDSHRRFGSQPIFCQASWNRKAMHKNSQVQQWALQSSRLEGTAACRHLHLHVLQTRPSQCVQTKLITFPHARSPASLLPRWKPLPIYQVLNLEIWVLSLLIPHSPRLICCPFFL